MAIKTIQDYEKKIAELEEVIDGQKEQLAQKEKTIYDLLDKNEVLDKKFDSKAWTISTVTAVYAVVITIFEAIKNPIFFKDIVSAIIWIKNAIISVFSFGLVVASFINQIFAGFPLEFVTSVIEIIIIGIIEILLFGLVLGVIVAILYGMYKKGNGLYRSKDAIWVAYTLVTVAVVIFFGEIIKSFVDINLLLLVFIMQIIFVAVRRRYQYKHPQY